MAARSVGSGQSEGSVCPAKSLHVWPKEGAAESWVRSSKMSGWMAMFSDSQALSASPRDYFYTRMKDWQRGLGCSVYINTKRPRPSWDQRWSCWKEYRLSQTYEVTTVWVTIERSDQTKGTKIGNILDYNSLAAIYIVGILKQANFVFNPFQMVKIGCFKIK